MVRLISVVAIVASLWLAWIAQYGIFKYFNITWNSATLGQWGDTFGALSALFSASAFIGAIYALIQQQRQIDQARSDQEKVNREAREEIHRQRFENSYFELLRLLREVRNEVRFTTLGDYDINGINISRKVFLHEGPDAFRKAWLAIVKNITENERIPDRAEAGRIYNDIIQKKHEANFSPYFRLLYTILNKLKYDAVLSVEEKLEYARLLRSQLTSDELAVAGVNGLSPVSKDFSDLLTHYRMLKYLPAGNRLKILKIYYQNEAFSSRD